MDDLLAAGLSQRRRDYRVMAWVKPFASFKPGVNPGYCWEPVIVRGGRKMGRDRPTVRDYVAESITLQKGLAGAKPRGFSYWLFEVLGMLPGDRLDDLFPGSGAVSRAFEEWTSFAWLRDLTKDARQPKKLGRLVA